MAYRRVFANYHRLDQDANGNLDIRDWTATSVRQFVTDNRPPARRCRRAETTFSRVLRVHRAERLGWQGAAGALCVWRERRSIEWTEPSSFWQCRRYGKRSGQRSQHPVSVPG